MNSKNESGRDTAAKLIFPCSGAADVGEISDRAARKLTRDGVGKMFCLAGVGGHVDTFLASTRAAGKILVIDGCPVDCGKKILEREGITGITHLRITDLGMEKGKSPADDERISLAAEKAGALLA